MLRLSKKNQYLNQRLNLNLNPKLNQRLSRKRQKKERRVTESFITQILEKRSQKSKLKINTPFVKLSCSSELKRVLKQKEKEAKLAEKKAAQPAKPAPGKPKPKEDDAEVDPSKYNDNRKKFI